MGRFSISSLRGPDLLWGLSSFLSDDKSVNLKMSSGMLRRVAPSNWHTFQKCLLSSSPGWWVIIALMMVAVSTSETLVDFYETTWYRSARARMLVLPGRDWDLPRPKPTFLLFQPKQSPISYLQSALIILSLILAYMLLSEYKCQYSLNELFNTMELTFWLF